MGASLLALAKSIYYKYLTFLLVFISLRYNDAENKNMRLFLANEVWENFG